MIIKYKSFYCYHDTLEIRDVCFNADENGNFEIDFTNFDKNSIWIKPMDDADYALAQSAYVNAVDTSKTTGLKFVQDNEGKIEVGATIFNENKSD